MNIRLLALTLALIQLIGCQPSTQQANLVKTTQYRQPPLPGVDVPFSNYILNAQVGDTIFHPSGSILLFPPNAFVDETGKTIEGKVDIQYREFADPLDLFLAGASMRYDSAGTGYQLVSSGMFDIYGTQQGKAVYINQQAKPEIILAATSPNAATNIYYFDSTARKWIYKGDNSIVMLNSTNAEMPNQPSVLSNELLPPTKPQQANQKTPVIELDIDPNSFKELLAYQGLKFQLEPGQPFDAMDANAEWSDVKLNKSEKPGLYWVEFRSKAKNLRYLAKPVLEGKDYTQALAAYEQQQHIYEQRKQLRENEEKNSEERFRRDSLRAVAQAINLEKVRRMNALIEARNREIDRLDSINLAAENRRNQSVQIAKFTQSLTIDGFGMWNCDNPILIGKNTIQANFVDQQGKSITPATLAVIYENTQSVLSCSPADVPVFPDQRFAFFASVDGKFAYVAYPETAKQPITPEKKSYTFTMQVLPAGEASYQKIKAWLKP